MIRTYYYNQQLKKFMIGFANVFTGLTVRTGKNGDGEISIVDVPIHYGSKDRVVAALSASNTQNKLHTLPIMACYMIGLDLAPDRMHGVNQVDRRTHLPQGGIFPDDVKVIERVMPIPYNMQMELSIYVSNTDQLLQVLEQILILFDYDLQVQFNDAPFDWTKITKMTLTGLSNEEQYPLGVDRRALMWTLTFELPIWLSPPAEVRNEIIKEINLRLGNLEEFKLNELDEDGNLQPFSDPWMHVVLDTTPTGDPRTTVLEPTPAPTPAP